MSYKSWWINSISIVSVSIYILKFTYDSQLDLYEIICIIKLDTTSKKGTMATLRFLKVEPWNVKKITFEYAVRTTAVGMILILFVLGLKFGNMTTDQVCMIIEQCAHASSEPVVALLTALGGIMGILCLFCFSWITSYLIIRKFLVRQY